MLGLNPVDWFIAAGFNKIVPISGKYKPYEPELVTYPVEPTELPFEPEIIWNTLLDPKKVATDCTPELSVKVTFPPDPEILKLKVPGNNFSLYLALSTEIIQKSFEVY